MQKDRYYLSEFIADALQLMAEEQDESRLLERLAPLAQRAAIDPGWRTEAMLEADPELGFGSTLLHAEEDHSLFVVADSWLPGRGVQPHNHGTWAIVVGVTGPEHNLFWQRTAPDSAELQQLREEVIDIGEVTCMSSDAIHSVENRTAETTLSFHVYGRHLNFTGRSRFDIDQQLEIPFMIETR